MYKGKSEFGQIFDETFIHKENSGNSYSGDPRPSPGRKSSHGVEIESQIIPKPVKIEKVRKTRKTAGNLMYDRIFDLENEFSLC